MCQPRDRLTGERAGQQQRLLFQYYTHSTTASTIRCANAHAYIYTNAHRFHKDIEGRADGLLPLVPGGGEREVCERCSGDWPRRHLGWSAMQWSIFILRSAKWGHSGGLAEYIPHLHHESSAAYYSCPAQGGLAFIQSNGLCVRVCAHATLSMMCASKLSCTTSGERGDRYSPCDRLSAGCLMRKWMRGDIHWLLFTHHPPPFSTAFRLPLRQAEQAAGSHSNRHW